MIVKISIKRAKILCLLAQGLEPEAIAEVEHIAVSTLHSYMKRLRQQVGAQNNAHLVAIAFAHGYIDIGMNEDGGLRCFPATDRDVLKPEVRSITRAQLRTAQDALERGTSISEAARRAGIDRQTIHRHLPVKEIQARYSKERELAVG